VLLVVRVARLYRLLIRWGFARFYHEFAWSYDAVAWLVSRGLWRRWTLAALPYLQGRVLEVGCGTGHVQLALATVRPGQAVGLDESPTMLARTRRRLRRAEHKGALLRGVAQALPFEAASFNTVLATFPSDYILLPETLHEIHRVLRQGGNLIIVDAARFTSSGIYERTLDLAYRATLQSSVKNAPITPPSSYLHLLERAGFACEAFAEQVGPSQVMVLVGRRLEEPDNGERSSHAARR
jgi:ubiquinone/menaquinone biosynthesis C-methylase UbiE